MSVDANPDIGYAYINVNARVEVNVGCQTVYSPEVDLGPMAQVDNVFVDVADAEADEPRTSVLGDIRSRGQSLGPSVDVEEEANKGQFVFVKEMPLVANV